MVPSLRNHKDRRWRWWWMVGLNILLLLAGQTIAILLGRFYFDYGGSSKWMATLVQSVGFPILLFSYFFTPATAATPRAPPLHLTGIYLSIGLLLAADNLMYSYGLLYLPVSTYSLICATQLAFNAVLSRLINRQKFTHLIFNSVVIISLSAALLGVHEEGGPSSSSSSFAAGFFLTLGAAAIFALILCLMQLSFEKVIKSQSFYSVMEMQIATATVASAASAVGIMASGEWRSIPGEAAEFGKGKAAYVIVLVGTAVGWQLTQVGVVGLVFLVSALFSNVIGTVALPLVPVFGAVFFGDSMDGVKIIALLLALWGFESYIYQHYLDDKERGNDRDEEAATVVETPSSS